MEDKAQDTKEMLITLTSDIVAAHVSNNSVSVDDITALISNVYGALSGLGEALRSKGRIHLVKYPIVHDGRDLSVRRENDLAAHRHPDVGMRVSRGSSNKDDE